MKVQLKQFGETLSSRQAGSDAYADFLSTLSTLSAADTVEIDFTGISSLSPSWGDEFLTPLVKKLGEKLVLSNSPNLSVNATIELLEEIHGFKFSHPV